MFSGQISRNALWAWPKPAALQNSLIKPTEVANYSEAEAWNCEIVHQRTYLFVTKRGSDLSTRSSCQEKGSRRVIGTKTHLFCTNQSVKRTKLERNWVLGGEVGSEKWKCWENILLAFHSPPERDRLTDTHRKDKHKIFKIQFCEKWKCR